MLGGGTYNQNAYSSSGSEPDWSGSAARLRTRRSLSCFERLQYQLDSSGI